MSETFSVILDKAYVFPKPEQTVIKEAVKEWLKAVGLPDYFTIGQAGIGFNATESLRKLLITLVDEPCTTSAGGCLREK